MSGPIFINYRRNASAHAAGRLADQLAKHFDRRQLFMDVDGIEPGLDFVKVLNEQVAQCGAFIAIIGPGWADAKNSAGARSLDNPNDYVRIEIEAALNRDIRVIPVLVDGARMPVADELPESLKPLSRRNAVEVTHHRFSLEVDALAETLQRALGLEQKPNATDPAARQPAASQDVSWAEYLFSFNGRISRKSFWLSFLGIVAVACLMYGSFALLLGPAAFERKNDEWHPTTLFKGIYWVAVVPLYWPFFALLLKRLHDFGQGWGFVWPVAFLTVLYKILDLTAPESGALATAAVLFSIYAMIGCTRGTRGPNEYGPDPLAQKKQT